MILFSSAAARARALAGVLTFVAAGAAAQGVPPLPGAAEPGRELRQPVAPALPPADFDLTLQSPRRAPVPRAVDELRFEVREIRVSGATVYPIEALRPLWEPLLGQEVGLAEVVGVAEAIEAKYRGDGYILTRAFVPPQRVADGIFQINVVEGYVKAVAVDGGSEVTRARLERMLAPVAFSRPLRQDVIERALLLAGDLPGVEASGLLRPSPDEPGASDLVVSVRESVFSAGGLVGNLGSKVSGRWIGGGEVALANLLGLGEQIVFSPSLAFDTPERFVGIVRYLQPIGADGLLGSLTVVASEGKPGEALSAFNVQTDSFSVGPRLTYPLIRTRAQSLFLDGGFTVQSSNVNFRGLADVDRAAIDQEDKWRVLDVAASWTQNGFLDGVTSVTVGIAQGLDIFGASREGPGRSRLDGSPSFTKITGALRRLQLIEGPVSAFAAVQGQRSFGGLFAGEEVAYGGAELGRGYDPAAITGDDGVGGTFELRWDERFGEPLLDVFRAAQFYGFVDAAKVWNRSAAQGNESLASAGFGVRANFEYGVSTTLEYAKTLRTVPSSDGPTLLFTTKFRF